MRLFVTGGSRGIGRHVALAALERGHDVAFTYVNPETNVAELLREAEAVARGGRCRAYRLDIADPAAVAEVVDRAIEDFEGMDAVVNNAGINRNNLAVSMTDQEWLDVINTNLSGTFYVIRQFLPLFLANRKGRFVTISSLAKDGISGQVNYSASKAGLIGISGAIAKEYGPKGITSNVVVPGMFETDMTRQTLSQSFRTFGLQHCPLRRMGNPGELSDAILFLASDAAGYITGQVINVTGGLDFTI
jgi:3-oxoacyl-[acyl-carrier protein] reductase